MALTAPFLLAAFLSTGQAANQARWDFELFAPLHPNPQVRRRQFGELLAAIKTGKAQLKLEAGVEQVLEDAEANWIPGSVPQGAEGGLNQLPYVRGIVFYSPTIKGNLMGKQDYLVECRIFVAGKRDERFGVWSATKRYLAQFDYIDGYAYETADFTKLMGSFPGGRIHPLVEDQAKRRLTSIATDSVVNNPAPINSVYVRGEGRASSSAAPPPPVGESAKMPPDTRIVLVPPKPPADGDPPMVEAPAEQPKFTRYEVILDAISRKESTQSANDIQWWGTLGEGALLEARLGSLLSVRCTPQQARLIASKPDVAQVRLPRGPVVTPSPVAGQTKAPVAIRGSSASSALVILHHDFQGWREQVGKSIPEGTVMVDLTRERNKELVPDPFPTPAGQSGPGTLLAIECAKTTKVAPVLARIDPRSPAMLRKLVLALTGERYPPELLLFRQGEAREEISRLGGQLIKAEEAREAAETSTEGDASEQLALRKKAMEAVANINKRINELSRLDQEIVFFQSDLLGLSKAGVVVSGISWLEGHPQGGLSGASRLIEESLRGRLVWIQIVPETRPQVWAGLLSDRDGNGFAELRTGVTPHDSEFLPLVWATNAEGGNKSGKFRLTVQHHEAHHPELLKSRPDLFRSPINRIRPVVVYQSADATSGDPWTILGQGDGVALKLQQDPSGASWEQQVDIVIDKPGKYAVRLEADPALDVVPREVGSIPASRRRSAAQVRMILSRLEGDGHPRWAQASGWLPELPEWVAMPGMAGGTVTVGPIPAVASSDLMPGLLCKPEQGVEGTLPLRGDHPLIFKKAATTVGEAIRAWSAGQAVDRTRARFQKAGEQAGY